MITQSTGLTKEMILASLKALPFSNGGLVVSAGAAMVLLGLRQTTGDIDAACTFDPFMMTVQTVCRQTGNDVQLHYSYPYQVLIAELPGEIDLHLETNRIKFAKEFREGLHLKGMPADMRVLSPRALLEQKKKLNRQKDLPDIQALEKYLMNNP